MNLPELTREVAKYYQYIAEYDRRDAWQTIKETTKNAGGDCEDAALAFCCRLLDMTRGEGWSARLIIGTVPAGGHAWCWFRSPDGEEWWADPTFGGPGRCSKELWPGYEPRWAYDFAEDGRLINPQEVRRKEG